MTDIYPLFFMRALRIILYSNAPIQELLNDSEEDRPITSEEKCVVLSVYMLALMLDGAHRTSCARHRTWRPNGSAVAQVPCRTTRKNCGGRWWTRWTPG